MTTLHSVPLSPLPSMADFRARLREILGIGRFRIRQDGGIDIKTAQVGGWMPWGHIHNPRTQRTLFGAPQLHQRARGVDVADAPAAGTPCPQGTGAPAAAPDAVAAALSALDGLVTFLDAYFSDRRRLSQADRRRRCNVMMDGHGRA